MMLFQTTGGGLLRFYHMLGYHHQRAKMYFRLLDMDLKMLTFTNKADETILRYYNCKYIFVWSKLCEKLEFKDFAGHFQS